MKKIIALVLALIMIACLASCGEPEVISTMAGIYKDGYRAEFMTIEDNCYAAIVSKDGKEQSIVICEISAYQKEQIEPLYEQGIESEKELINIIAQNSFAQFIPSTVLGVDTMDQAFLDEYVTQFVNEGKGIETGEEVASLETLNDKAGSSIMKFSAVGVSEEEFSVTDDGVAQYQFRLGGNDYMVRATTDLTCDVSGLSAYDEPIVNEYGVASLKSFENEDVKSVGFVYDGVQYAFIVYDEGSLSYDDFDDIAEGYREQIYSQSCDKRLLELEGTEDAENDSSVMMLGLPMSADTIQISIYQYAKDGGTKAYAMQCYLKDDRLVYDEMVLTEFVDYQLRYTVCEGGYFDYDGETLKWTGAPTAELAKIYFD